MGNPKEKRTAEQEQLLKDALETSRKKPIEERLKDAVTNDAKGLETELRQRFGPIPDRFHIKRDKEYDLVAYIGGLANNQGKNRQRFVSDLCDRSVIRLTEPEEVPTEAVATEAPTAKKVVTSKPAAETKDK